MGILLLIAFIVVPLAEIAVFVQVGGAVGLWPTVGMVVLTAVIGTALLRIQGLATLMRARESLARDELPVREVFDGFCLLFSGALLLTPGFITDGIGFLMFLPPVRDALRRVAAAHLVAHGSVHVYPGSMGPPPGPDGSPRPGVGPGPGPVIDGDWETVGEDNQRPPKP